MLAEDGEDVLRAVAGSGLGILRATDERPISVSFAQLPPEVRRLAREKNLLNLTKANSRATVHRPSYLDYVGVKRFDADGEVAGERRFLGLYTHTAYSASPWEIPVLRRKAERVVERSGLLRGSHDHKALVDILETYPRDELFQITEDELFETALGILHLGERRRVRLFVRRDAFGRFLSCLVYLPRERFDTGNRQRIQEILQRGVRRRRASTTRRACPSRCWRASTSSSTPSRARRRTYDVAEIEARLAAATRAWTDDLRDALSEQLGEQRAGPLLERYGEAFPGAYREDFSAAPGRARHRADRAPRPRRRPRDEPLRPARVHARPPRVQARPLGQADPPLGRAAAAREHGRPGQRRAAVRGQAGRRAAGLDLRLRAPARRRRRAPRRRRARDVPGRVRARLARRDRERRLQPPRPLGQADRARDHGPARDRQVPPPGRQHVQPDLHGGRAFRAPGRGARAGRALPAATRSGTVGGRRRAGTRTRAGARAHDRRRREPRRGPDPARLPARRPGGAADELLPDGRRRGRRSRTSRSSSTPSSFPTCPSRGRCSRSSSTRRASRPSTCAAARSRAAASAGPTAARTSAPRCSA